MRHLSVFALPFLFAGCGGAAASSAGPTGTAMPPPASNTSIASALPLAPGDSVDVVLPCSGSVYFGPFQFAAEGEILDLVSNARSSRGGQVCGGGDVIDGDEVFQAVAGTGCPEGDALTTMSLQYSYTPAAGGSAANPVYLRLNLGEPRPDGCETQIVNLQRR